MAPTIRRKHLRHARRTDQTWFLGRSTHRGNSFYVHVLAWPEGDLSLPLLSRKILSARLLTAGDAVVQQPDQGVLIRANAAARQELDTIIELTLDGPAADSLAPGERNWAAVG